MEFAARERTWRAHETRRGEEFQTPEERGAGLNRQGLQARDALWAAACGVLALVVYVRTLIPYLLPLDSGEFQVLVPQLGLAHTPGYSTYLLLGHLFARSVPWGDAAYRVNLFSAVMGAVTVSLVYLAAALLCGRRLAAAVAALCFAAGYTFWSQAIIAEVYTTGAAFAAAVLVFVLLWYRGHKRWPIFVAGLLGGAGLGAHSSVGLLGLLVAVFLLLNWRRWRAWVLPGAAGAALGLALYAGGMLLVDANQAPANVFNAAYAPSRSKWGLSAAAVADPSVRTWFLASAGQWKGALFNNPSVDTPVNLASFLLKLPREFSPAAWLLAVAGAVLLVRRDWRLAVLLLGAAVLQLAIYTNYDVGDRYVFFIPVYLLGALLLSAGVAGLQEWLGRRPWGSPAVQGAAVALVALLCLLPLLQPRWPAIVDGANPFLGERDFLADARSRTVATVAGQVTGELEPDAIVLTDWYWLFPYYYAAHLQQAKPQMRFVETYPRADTPGLADSLLEYIDANIDQRPIYVDKRDGALVAAGYRLRNVRVGPTFMYRLERGG